MRYLAHIAIVVPGYDEAIEWFRDKLGFRVVEDTKLTETKRWVLVSPNSHDAPALLLAKAATDEQRAVVGNQAAGRVFLFLATDDFWGDYNRLRERGVEFLEEPREEPYATVAVFRDHLGNKWDLLEPKERPSSPTTPEQ